MRASENDSKRRFCHQSISGEKQPDGEPTGSLLNVMIDLPTTFCTTLDSVNPVLYPAIDTILIKLCVLLTMPVASATAEMPFSVLRRLETYVRSTMKNDRLSSLELMHILTEILKWTCTQQWRCSYLLRHEGQILDNLKKFLSIKVIKIVLDSML